ncbi:MAG: cytochrome c biogenesis protein CcsA [Saprospiraceae bacterium]|nr:cytochrome c biogenesis protein CcsA [Saprospiraceae bacterium]
MSAAGIYILLFAIAIGVATFVENDFGTSAAQKVIYRARWFEILLLLFCISLVVNIVRYRMIENRKWTILTFHVSFIIILIGSAITRYHSYEGMMHIREGESANTFLSSETHLNFEVLKDGDVYQFSEPVLFASLGNNEFNEEYRLGSKVVEAELVRFLPNPIREMRETQEGRPTLKIVMGGPNGRREYYLQEGRSLNLGGQVFNFKEQAFPGAVQFDIIDGMISVNLPERASQMQMATQQRDTLEPGIYHSLQLRSLYSFGQTNFVIGEYSPSAEVAESSESKKMKSESIGRVDLKIASGGQEEIVTLYGRKGVDGRERSVRVNDMEIRTSYGSKVYQLPFSLRLRDFQMEKYPGTNSASSYASEVTLLDPRDNINMDYRIYMNNILTYDGYRFFQSSFDQDELGTYLSVNHDFWGTWVSYLGYFLLTIGMIMTLFDKKSRFYQISSRLKSKKGAWPKTAVAIAMLVLSQPAFSQVNAPKIDDEHADLFAELAVQDHRGRIKPMHTMSSEVLRKLARKTEIYGLSAHQVYLGMSIFPDSWTTVPIIKLGHHQNIHDIVGSEGPLVTYRDLFDASGRYKLKEEVRRAHSMNTVDRGVLEKELMKLDERVNIMNLILNRRMMRIFPVEGDPNNLWISPGEIDRPHGGTSIEVDEYAQQWFPAYSAMLHDAVKTDNWELPNELLRELKEYQKRKGSEVIPSDTKLNAEILLNNLKVFSRLGMIYGLMGIIFLVIFFVSVFRPELNLKKINSVGFYLVFAAFLFHVFGLALRWYVSGRAPWSNGYESMIYIGFTTMLAGLIFARKSSGGLAATSILASVILMVASLSYLDPEITPLVPVLKSYWLTIHVSLEAGSYGFLMLGAIIGVINLVLLLLLNQNNQQRVKSKVKELTMISELTLTAGLFMISIGTYLGGVWANESWGRYWGWDAKETWALVTILVYAFILHMRFIPGLRGVLAFNVASLVGFASVMMTYFGVNYYLSGLHSYAAGDPVPIPTWVYYTAISLTILSLAAYIKRRFFDRSMMSPIGKTRYSVPE